MGHVFVMLRVTTSSVKRFEFLCIVSIVIVNLAVVNTF